MRYWWVNQNQTHRAEIRGSFMWSPKQRADGVRHQFYENMCEVSPGDAAVLTLSDGSVRMTTTPQLKEQISSALTSGTGEAEATGATNGSVVISLPQGTL